MMSWQGRLLRERRGAPALLLSPQFVLHVALDACDREASGREGGVRGVLARQVLVGSLTQDARKSELVYFRDKGAGELGQRRECYDVTGKAPIAVRGVIVWVQQAARTGHIGYSKAEGTDNAADLFTKPLPTSEQLSQLVHLLGCSERGRAASAPPMKPDRLTQTGNVITEPNGRRHGSMLSGQFGRVV